MCLVLRVEALIEWNFGVVCAIVEKKSRLSSIKLRREAKKVAVVFNVNWLVSDV
jgi:hypothetical protein